jgi:beta-lactamase class A
MDLVKQMNDLSDAQPYKVSWYMKNWKTGEEYSRNGGTVVGTRSTRKVSIMMALLKAVHDGKFSLSQPVTISDKLIDTKSGVTQFMMPNPTIKLYDAMLLMIIISDNPSTATIVNMLGLDYLNEYVKSIGMKDTIHRFSLPIWVPDLDVNTVSTANDQGMLLGKILRGCTDEKAAMELGCTSELCNVAMKVLKSQRSRNAIPLYLPEGTVTASKGGAGPGMNSDIAIVFQDGQPLYIIAIYCWDVPSELAGGIPGATGAHQFMGSLSKTVWNALKS